MLHGGSHDEATGPWRDQTINLHTNKNGQYMHDAILILQKGIRCVLQSQFNPSNMGKGMEELLDNGDNQLTLVMLTDAITAGSVIKKAELHVESLLTSTGKTVLPTITTQAEAQEEANRLSVINQSVIGTKGGTVDAITKLVGSNITNAILHTANGSNHKSVDDFKLFNVMQVAIGGADRPSMKDVLEQLLEVINHTFNFCKKISITWLLQWSTAQMATYGIIIGIPQLVLMLLANIETATKSDYGHEFRLAMHVIRKKYTYNHMHDATSLNHFEGACRCQWGEGSKRCTHPRRRNGEFRDQPGVFPSLNDGRRQLQLGIHQLGIQCHIHQQIIRGGTQTTRIRPQERKTIQATQQKREEQE